MNRLLSLLTGAGVGAGWMYFFDPARGNRRRSLLRDQAIHAWTQTRHDLDASLRDMGNRIHGTFAEARSIFSSDGADDEVICARVRSKMGRHVSHPSSIEVACHDGHVTLRGPILAHEVDSLMAAVRSVRGVNGLTNELEVHKTAGNISALQGGSPPRGEPAELMQAYWTPTTRVATGALGGVLMLNCLARRTPGAIALGVGGFLLSLRALSNLESKRLLGLRGRRGIDIQKTITIERPVNEVFDFLTEPTNYPRISDLIRSVEVLGDGRIQKTVVGPGGAEIMLVERITAREPNHFMAKRSEPDSPFQYAVRMWFLPEGDSSTRLQVQATYNPPGGVFTHAIARATGMDPKTMLDDIAVRAKSYLETGVQPHDAAQREAAVI